MVKEKIIEKCSIKGCKNNRRYSNGLCSMHYRRMKSHGDPLWEPSPKKTGCKVAGCDRPHFANGFCRSHDGQIRFHGKIIEGSKFKKLSQCSVDGCELVTAAAGMCAKHYQNYKKYGYPEHVRVNITDLEEYEVWCGMVSRCHYGKHKSYKYYGGRGIRVCENWKNSFDRFYEDMGARPSKHHQIDRKDNEGNYEPGNCNWVTSKVNNSHKSNSVVTKEFIESIRSLKDKGMKQEDIIRKTGSSRSSVQRAYKLIRDKI